MAIKVNKNEAGLKCVNGAEDWKPHPRYTKYEVSTEGRVRRYYKRGNFYHYLTPIRDNHNNMVVQVGGRVQMLGKLVWETFKGEVPAGYVICQRNGCKTMCDIYNLYLGKKNHFRGGFKKVVDTKEKKIYKDVESAAKYTEKSRWAIYQQCNGTTKKQRFYYYEDYLHIKRSTTTAM